MLTPKTEKRKVSIPLDQDIHNILSRFAERKGMDMTKLCRAILTNYAKPHTFNL